MTEMPNKIKNKIRFIINPISGGKSKVVIEKLIRMEFSNSDYDLDIQYTKYRHHATEIAKQSIEEGFNTVIAVGGDGTVNEVARALISTKILFGIIPMGSGNGLSRFLNIPMNYRKALQLIKNGRSFKMDTIIANNEHFVNMAGVGFDALISHLFANYGKRGFISYLKLITREFFRYKDNTYKLLINGQLHEYNAFLISFANSSQFGNGAHIAPLAEINDGLIDICILNKFPRWKSFIITVLLYSKGLARSKYYSVIKTPSLEILNNNKLFAHIDGDPVIFDSNVKIEIVPLSLNIIVP
jgi:YegS/Rv2252/BmrU family lipid kinase